MLRGLGINVELLMSRNACDSVPLWLVRTLSKSLHISFFSLIDYEEAPVLD